MTIAITIKSRKLGETLHFVARDSGYVFVNPSPTDWGRQIMDRHGNAEIAATEEGLRRIARRWIARHERVVVYHYK